MPIFDLNDFEYRRVLKLAPDAFVVFNGALGGRIVSPLKPNQYQNIDPQGGITSVNANGTVSPPGSGRATIQVVAPRYKGLHQDYYVTVPSGVRVPYFLPMMEVKVYMKGRFFANNNPVYYPAFWGIIIDISEDYSDGVFTFTLQCSDVLTWWKYQKLTINPSVYTNVFGGPKIENMPTVFRNKNPWQIIYQLLMDTQWRSKDNESTYNFVYPNLSNINLLPDLGGIPPSTIGALAVQVNKYWSDRFSFSGETVPLEMFGLTKEITTEEMKVMDELQKAGIDSIDSRYSERIAADIALDYNLLARVLPFGDLNLFGDGSSPMEYTKLEIAQRVCELTTMEFYLDLNGTMVFKPPFYNMDVTKADVPYYVIEPSDVVNFNANVNSDHIVTFLEVSAPKIQRVQEIDIIGFHIDWDLMARYGMRYQKAHIAYGNDSKSLRLIAAAEMARINGRATSGSITIPLRPEMRLGYPVYISHIDAYYYINSISHSFSYGSSANTTLSMEMRRDRMYDPTGEVVNQIAPVVQSNQTLDNTNTSDIGRVLRGFVYRFREGSTITANTMFQNTPDGQAAKLAANAVNFNNPSYVQLLQQKEDFKRLTQAMTGPRFNGFYEISPARIAAGSFNAVTQNTSTVNASGDKSTVMSNELLMITDSTIPFTDVNGYKHIGAFPYGANLQLVGGVDLVDKTDIEGQLDEIARKVLQEPNQDGNPMQEISPVNKNAPVFQPLASAPITQNSTQQMLADPVTSGTGNGNKNQSLAMGSYTPPTTG